jgi:hypothetical protein
MSRTRKLIAEKAECFTQNLCDEIIFLVLSFF